MERKGPYRISIAQAEAVQSLTDVCLFSQLDAADLPHPEREVRFHPTRRWRFDYAWDAAKVAVEVEGGVWGGGRHVRGRGYLDDCQKYNEAQLLGWLVLRFSPEQIQDGSAINFIREALIQRRTACAHPAS
jgi:very-short-patch-repair endonuclease